MPTSLPTFSRLSHSPWTLRLAVMAGVLGLLLLLGSAAPVLAQTDQPADRPCAACHLQEDQAWIVSPHALARDPESGNAPGAACQDCHGDYVRGHPEDGLMALTVDSSSCHTCHTDTFTRWEDTVHAQAGVQCISCHQSHSQTLRLTDDELCVSCHRESLDDSLHLAHWQSDVTCTSCHMMVGYDAVALAAVGANPLPTTPRHDFVTVMSANCLNCHREDANKAVSPKDNVGLKASLASQADQIYTLNSELAGARRSNRTLGTLSVVTLGAGLGAGAILGIIFLLVISRMEKRKEGI